MLFCENDDVGRRAGRRVAMYATLASCFSADKGACEFAGSLHRALESHFSYQPPLVFPLKMIPTPPSPFRGVSGTYSYRLCIVVRGVVSFYMCDRAEIEFPHGTCAVYCSESLRIPADVSPFLFLISRLYAFRRKHAAEYFTRVICNKFVNTKKEKLVNHGSTGLHKYLSICVQ